jgi:predicted transcriptional regulator
VGTDFAISAGRWLERERRKTGFSQEYLATQLGRQQSFISKLENGSIEISLSDFVAICRVLELSPEEALREVVNIHQGRLL